MPDRDDIWYAAHATRIVLAPSRQIETFGETRVHYVVLSELLDEIDKVRIRQGRITAARPRVITPQYFVNQALENFGDNARQYIERLLKSSDGMRIIEYGLRFSKEEYGEEVVGGRIAELAAQVSADKSERDDGIVYGVIIGVDDLWEVSLLKFASDLVHGSVAHNARELQGSGLLDPSSGGVPNAVRIEIESDFRAAVGSRNRIESLGGKLRRYGLFQQYEDRYYELVRAARSSS